jgi:hypothetical protein
LENILQIIGESWVESVIFRRFLERNTPLFT